MAYRMFAAQRAAEAKTKTPPRPRRFPIIEASPGKTERRHGAKARANADAAFAPRPAASSGDATDVAPDPEGK